MISIKWAPGGDPLKSKGFIAPGLRLQGNAQRKADISRKAMIDDHRGWTPLHAVAWIASRSKELVDTVTEQLFMNLRGIPKAPLANQCLQLALSSGAYEMSYQQAVAELLTELRRGKITGWTGPDSLVWFGTLDITGISYEGDHVGFELQGRPAADWASVLLDTAAIEASWPERRVDLAEPGDIAADKPKPSEPERRPASSTPVWDQKRMQTAIENWVAANSSRDRDQAWRTHFKALKSEHGWNNDSFRALWSKASGSNGTPGPVRKSA